MAVHMAATDGVFGDDQFRVVVVVFPHGVLGGIFD